MNVLSLFDGMSCGQIALERAGIKVDNYFASEIDKYAIQVTMANYPNTIQLGDVCHWGYDGSSFVSNPIFNKDHDEIYAGKIDLLIGGSPCQGFSFAGNQLNFSDPRSKLFFEYVRFLKELRKTNPHILFLLENVKMAKDSEDVITKYLRVRPVRLNSSLVSAQNRQRLYWTNIPVTTIPHNKRISLSDIVEHGFVDRNKSYCVDANYFKGTNQKQYHTKSRRQIVYEKPHGANKGGFQDRNKFPTLRECSADNYAISDNNTWRKLTPVEVERLQTVPDGYTNHASNAQRYKMLGNGWTVDIIAHIFKHIPATSN